jgi:hypothetical protein
MNFKTYNDSWGMFSEREMNRNEISDSEKIQIERFWSEVTNTSKEFGGLEKYLLHLQSEKETEEKNILNLMELAIIGQKDFSWYIQGKEIIGADDYGNQVVIIHFKEVIKNIKKGLKPFDALYILIEKYLKDMEEFFEE